MPVSYAILKPHDLIYLRLNKQVTLSDFDKLRPLVLNDPDFKPTLAQLVDTRGGSLAGLSSAEIRQLASSTIFAPGVKRAFVAAKDIDYGLARMFEAFVQRHAQDVQVFRTLEEACRWLSIPVEAVPVSEADE